MADWLIRRHFHCDSPIKIGPVHRTSSSSASEWVDPPATSYSSSTRMPSPHSTGAAASQWFSLQRAFHKVWNVELLHKILAAQVHAGFNSYLFRRHHRVQVDNQQSRIYISQSGVPQGSMLSPLLFIFYCHDTIRPLG